MQTRHSHSAHYTRRHRISRRCGQTAKTDLDDSSGDDNDDDHDETRDDDGDLDSGYNDNGGGFVNDGDAGFNAR